MFEETKRELAAAAAADLSASSAAALNEEMRELHEIELAVAAQRLRRLEVFDRLEGYVDVSQVTSAAWLRTQLGLTNAAAAAEVSASRVRRRCPELTRIFETGRTSFRHLQVVAGAMRRLPEPEIWELLDERITGWAQKTNVREFAEMLDALVEQLKPEPKPKDEKQAEQRRLSVTTGFDGMVNVSGRLTPEVGEKLDAALSAASRPDVEGETRNAGQRKADALERVLDTVLDTAALPVDGGEKPHINVYVPFDGLDEDNTPTDADSTVGPIWADPGLRQQRATAAVAFTEALDHRPRFSWTGPTSHSTVRRLACDGILLPIFTRKGESIDAGVRRRVVDARLRTFVIARDRHCQWPRCEAAARWCDVHHVRHWKDGGPTDRWNVLLLCSAHHKAAHSGKFVVVLHSPGKISTRPRRADDPYYEIRFREPPPPPDQLTLDKLSPATGDV